MKLRPDDPACGLREKAGVRQVKPTVQGTRGPGMRLYSPRQVTLSPWPSLSS